MAATERNFKAADRNLKVAEQLIVFGRFWQYWQQLTTIDRFKLLAFGSSWLYLASANSIRQHHQLLAAVDSTWQQLASGNIWQPLTIFSRSWQYLFGINWQYLRAADIWQLTIILTSWKQLRGNRSSGMVPVYCLAKLWYSHPRRPCLYLIY